MARRIRDFEDKKYYLEGDLFPKGPNKFANTHFFYDQDHNDLLCVILNSNAGKNAKEDQLGRYYKIEQGYNFIRVLDVILKLKGKQMNELDKQANKKDFSQEDLDAIAAFAGLKPAELGQAIKDAKVEDNSEDDNADGDEDLHGDEAVTSGK